MKPANQPRRRPRSGKQKKALLQAQRAECHDQPFELKEQRDLLDLSAHVLVVSGPRVLLRINFRYQQQIASAAAALESSIPVRNLTQAELTEIRVTKRIRKLSCSLSAVGKMKPTEGSAAWRAALATCLAFLPDEAASLRSSAALGTWAFLLVQQALQSGPLQGSKAGAFKKLLLDSDRRLVTHLLEWATAAGATTFTAPQQQVLRSWMAGLAKNQTSGRRAK